MLISVVLMAAGCAQMQWEPDAAVADSGGALAWWSRAMEAGPVTRESMLRNARQTKSAWRTAMLRSLPGGSDAETPEASQEALRGLLRRGLRDEEAALTRIRVAELDQTKACQSEVGALRARLSRIIEIEKEMGNGR